MKTHKLYDENAFLSEFEATVLSSEKEGEIYKVILDKTCFFPEAGGQPSDTGVLGGAEVINVKEEDGEIVHYCRSSLCEGVTLSGKIDFDRRFAFMQNHTGEHIVSGIVHKKFGLNNVGFHLNCEFVTLDFDGILSEDQLEATEYLANKAVWKNHKVTAFYPTDDELASLDFRQKSEINGDIRLVEIEGIDLCACCAPHVEYTGQVGAVKFLSFEKMRGGTRILMKCGEYALKDHKSKHESVKRIGNALSLKSGEVADGVYALLEKLEKAEREISVLKKRIISNIADSTARKVSFVDGLSTGEMQSLADLLHKKKGGTYAVLSEKSESEFAFVICGDQTEVEKAFAALKSKLSIKGGGRNGMVTGVISEPKEKIVREFSI